MRIFKPLKLGLSTRAHPHNGAGMFVVTTFTLFDLLDPTDILAETAMWPLAGQELPTGAILDEGMPKPCGEVLIAGKAMAPNGQPVTEMSVGFEVGSVHRVFNIFGDRQWIGDPSEPTISAPQPFTEMPLIAERAFGGEGYAANPVGIGFRGESLLETGFAAPLPNIEIWGREMLEPTDQKRPALVGPISPAAQERIALAGTYDQYWIDHRMPEFPEDFDPRYYHAAPVEQRIDSFFAGDEPIYMIGMSPKQPEVISRLPGVRVRAFVKRASDPEGLREMGLHTDTVWIFGSQLKGVVINRGAIAIADRDGLDVEDIMVGYEWASEPERSWDHYAEVFRLRSDPEEGFKYLLADSQLAPTIPEEVRREREQRRLEQAEARMEKAHENMEWMQAKQIEKAGLPPELAPDIPKPETKPFLLPLPEEMASGDIDIARLMSDVEEVKRESDVKAALVDRKTAEMSEHLPSMPMDLPGRKMTDEELAAAQAELGPGPGFLPPVDELISSGELDDIFSTLEDRAALAEPLAETLDEERKAGLDGLLEGLAGRSVADDEEAFAKACARVLRHPEGSPLAEVRKQLDAVDTDTLSTPSWPEADGVNPAPSDPGAGSGIDVFLDEIAANVPGGGGNAADDLMDSLGKTLPALNTTSGESPVQALQKSLSSSVPEDDLPPVERLAKIRTELDKAEESFKESVDQARLMAPAAIYPVEPFSEEVATRLGAFIKERLEEGYDLSGADLAGADLSGADFSGCNLAGTCFETCNLVGARFNGADCSEAVFTGANLTGTEFTNTNLEGANLSTTESRHARFTGARLVGARIIKADLIDVDLSAADLTRVTLLECDLTRCRIDKAIVVDATIANIRADGLSADGATLSDFFVATGSFDGSSWKGATFEKVGFAQVSFERSDFTGARFVDAAFAVDVNFSGNRFDDVDAINSGFHGADFTGSSFRAATIKSCNFMQANLTDCDLRLVSMTKTNLNYAILRKADGFGGHFLGSRFRAADLHASSFRGANLYGADLSEARIMASDFTGANVRFTNMEASAE